MSEALSPYRLKKARRIYNWFTAFNAFSFALLSGNVITLYALRLGASSTLVGVLNAFSFVSFFFMPIGKRLVMRFPIIRVFAFAWIFRYLAMIPLLLAPFFAAYGRVDVALALMLVAVFAFHLFRGIGMIGNNPVLNQLATGSDRGSYMVQMQIVNSAVNMIASLSLALVLGRNPPLALYGVIMGGGIAAGVFGSLFLFKIPEPAENSDRDKSNFFATMSRSFASKPFRLFVAVFFCVSFVSSTARAFAVVYTRDAYAQGDGAVAMFAVFGGLGALAIGMLTRLLVDRVGAKPLYIVYTGVAFLSLLPTLISPGLGSTLWSAVFLTLFHFTLNFGFAGAEGVAQNYFFGLVKPEDLLDLGILYYVVYGAAGAAGSFLGGIFLDTLSVLGYPPVESYRIFFGVLLALLVFTLALQRGLVRLGALPLRGALGIIFSFRDLRALTLLNRLDSTRTPSEEAEVLEALHDAPSSASAAGLLDRARSPRLSVRLEAIRAIEALPELSEEVEAALISDTEQNQYTTAYVSARALGAHGSLKALGMLRRAMLSDDYMLAGESMVALARLGDAKSAAAIEDLVRESPNPRVLIMGVYALELLAQPSSLSALLDLLRREAPPPYLGDEVILAFSGILGFLDRFYPVYARYLENPAIGLTLVHDEADAIAEKYAAKLRRRAGMADRAAKLKDALAFFLRDGSGAGLARWIHEQKSRTMGVEDPLFAEAALDADLASHERFRFLLSFWAALALEKELRD